MNKNGASPLQRGEENDTVVEGDKGEQLIANVLLAVMVSQLCSDAAAKGYMHTPSPRRWRGSQLLIGLRSRPSSLG